MEERLKEVGLRLWLKLHCEASNYNIYVLHQITKTFPSFTQNLRELYALHQASTKKRKDDLLRSAQGTMREFLSTRAGFNTTGEEA